MNGYQIVSEALVFNEKDIQYRVDEWKQSKNGLLLISGYTGSGKSTTAKEMSEKYNASYVELDSYVEKEVKPYKNKIKKLYDSNRTDEINKIYQKIINKAITKVLSESSNKKRILEGIQIFLYDKPEKYKQHSVIVIGTSALISMFRAYKRNVKDKDYFERAGRWGIFDDIRANLFIKRVEQLRKLVNSWK